MQPIIFLHTPYLILHGEDGYESDCNCYKLRYLLLFIGIGGGYKNESNVEAFGEQQTCFFYARDNFNDLLEMRLNF